MTEPESRIAFDLLALGIFHERRPGVPIMVMTAYFDESGTHDEAPMMVVGGYVATARQWASFNIMLKELMDDAGVKKLHAKDFRNRNEDFKKLPYESYVNFNSGFLKIIDDNLPYGIFAVLNKNEYSDIYRSKFFKRKKIRPDSAYGLCFRVALMKAVSYISRVSYDKQFPLMTVLELGHRNSADAQRIYADLKNEFASLGAPWLGPMELEGKADCPPLAAADSLVYAAFRREAGFTCHENEMVIPAGPSTYSVRNSNITRVNVTPQFLDEFWRFG